jgi:hypothetical protein
MVCRSSPTGDVCGASAWGDSSSLHPRCFGRQVCVRSNVVSTITNRRHCRAIRGRVTVPIRHWGMLRGAHRCGEKQSVEHSSMALASSSCWARASLRGPQRRKTGPRRWPRDGPLLWAWPPDKPIVEVTGHRMVPRQMARISFRLAGLRRWHAWSSTLGTDSIRHISR